MISINKYITACFTAAVFALTGCQDEELFRNENRVDEGIPTKVSLNFVSQESIIETRMAQDEKYENQIENIYLFVFNEAGQRQPLLVNIDSNEERNSNVFTANDGLYPTDNNTSNGTGKLSFVCGSLNNATIVAIANVTQGNTNTAYTVTPGDLDKITTIGELKQKVMNMSEPAINRGALFMMTGYAEKTLPDETTTTAIDIVGSESGSTLEGISLKLRRTDARITVNVTGTAEDKTGFSFVPRTWRVVNVPSQSLILPDDTPKDADGTYFATKEAEFETYTNGVYGFVFYMPENLKTPKKEIENTPSATEEQQINYYAQREKWITEAHTDPTKPGQTVKNVSFANANDNSTYLEITGDLSYTNDKGAPVEATTRYYVHLGYENKNPNDYLTRRNYHYTYNITVKGVDKILLEVKNNQDLRPGYEGDVVYSEHAIYSLDAHYDRCLLEIKPSNISLGSTDEAATTWSVSTPFSSGVYDPSSGSFTGVEDYKWIKFAINKLHTKLNSSETYSHGEFVKYPGDQMYQPDFTPTSETKNEDLPKLLDIHQLLSYLKICKANADFAWSTLIPDNSTDGHICITAFVDEYVYVDDPTTPDVEDINEGLLLWKKFVNAPDREMHILSSGKTYSNDGNSSVTHSLYSFRQKAIRTIYNPNSGVTTAWGLETVMETDRLPVGNIPSSANSADNGRFNTLQWLGQGNLHWTDVLNTSNRYELNGNYSNALYACLLRNRDLDGDNIIDPEEIRWYLASINQLSDMYIGEYALDIDARLYPWDPSTGSYPPNEQGNVYWHYTSSTHDNNNKPFVVWAEEGPSRGNYSGSVNVNGANYAYRCVRNLGINLNATATAPADFIQVEDDGDSYTFDLSYLDPQALRDYYVEGAGEYTAHNEKSVHNLPYRKFTVGKELYVAPTQRYENTNNWQYYQTQNPCASKNYRVPNMREMLIFMSRKGNDLYEHWKDTYGHRGWFGWNSWLPGTVHIHSYTRFSLGSTPPYTGVERRDGYTYNATDGSMGPAKVNGNAGYTCGVRDVNN